MKLIIQIPCYNEAETLATTLAALPRTVAGFDEVEWLIVDDGSSDDTVRVARHNHVDHVVRHTRNQGLSQAFITGLQNSIRFGADVIVNTDADNQYNADDIPCLTAPILANQADIVIGARPIEAIEHFSLTKKLLQRLGSWVVRVASGTDVVDAPSGFRAISRAAAQRLAVFNDYTYTLETIIRIFVVYRPFRFFGTIGAVAFLIGFVIGLRFLWKYFGGEGEGHIQSLILASALLIIGFQTILVAFLADLLAANRMLLEDVRFSLRQMPESPRKLRMAKKARG